MKNIFCAAIVAILPNFSLADLSCRESFEGKVCVVDAHGKCSAEGASYYSDRILEVLETAHPTLQRVACEVTRYDVLLEGDTSWFDFQENAIGVQEFLFSDIVDEGFDELVLEAFSMSETQSLLYLKSGDPKNLPLRWGLYHELAHWLNYNVLPQNVFSCSDFEYVPEIVLRASLCEESCDDQFSQTEQAEAIRALSKSTHVTFYAAQNSVEDFAELLSVELLLRVDKSHAFYEHNGNVLFNLGHALNSPRFKHKLQIVDAMLDPPLDDLEDQDQFLYEWATCTGRFANPLVN